MENPASKPAFVIRPSEQRTINSILGNVLTMLLNDEGYIKIAFTGLNMLQP